MITVPPPSLYLTRSPVLNLSYCAVVRVIVSSAIITIEALEPSKPIADPVTSESDIVALGAAVELVCLNDKKRLDKEHRP